MIGMVLELSVSLSVEIETPPGKKSLGFYDHKRVEVPFRVLIDTQAQMSQSIIKRL